MYKEIISPILDHLDSERMHVKVRETLHWAEKSTLALNLLEMIANKGRSRYGDPRLNVNLGGILFDNPVMVGAGWDKYGRAVQALYSLGFSGVEVGTVPEFAQEGNPRKPNPRQRMLNSGVSWNWLGFNSPGMYSVDRNLNKYLGLGIPIGISLGKNKNISEEEAPEAHAVVARQLIKHASYLAINVSSPNTAGLRALQEKEPLTKIVEAVNRVKKDTQSKTPLFIKIAPDLSNPAIDDVIEVALNNDVTGIIATNTTNSSDIKIKYGMSPDTPGGIAGDDPDFRRMSTEKIAYIRFIAGQSLKIIGVGAVKDGKTAWEKITAGADLVQVVTGLRGEGLTVARKINQELVEVMDKCGVKSISEAVGQQTQECIRTFSLT